MERLYFQHVYEELEVMRNYMDSLFQQIQESNPIPLLPSSSEPSRKLLPGVQDNLQIQIVEYKDEIVVSAEMIPGDLKRDITINLIHFIQWPYKSPVYEESGKKRIKLNIPCANTVLGIYHRLFPFLRQSPAKAHMPH